MTKNKNTVNKKILKGFTLIELLVVIAIIGILSSVTIVTFSGSQAKAKDGTSRVELASLKTEATVYILDRSNWSAFCALTTSSAVDSDIKDLRTSIEARQGPSGSDDDFICVTASTDTLLYIGFEKNEVAGEYICFSINASTKRSTTVDNGTAAACGL